MARLFFFPSTVPESITVNQSRIHRLVAKYYREPDGKEPVDDFIEQQKASVRLAIDRQIDRIILSMKTIHT
jgi:hypothetical protein